jgi:hypothetical protein
MNKKFKFSNEIENFISTIKNIDATEEQLKETVKLIERKKIGFNLITDKIFLLAVKALREDFANIKTAEFIAGTIAEEIYEETHGDREAKKATREKNKIVSILEQKPDPDPDEQKALKKEKKNTPKYVQQEINGMKKRGGWRGGGRPKSTGQTTIAIRIDKRLEILVNGLKESLKNGTLDENEINEIELLLMRTKNKREIYERN